MNNSHEKVVLITGCDSGIGLATAKYFYERGWRVAATIQADTPPDGLAPNNRRLVFQLDVTEAHDREQGIARVIEQFGQIDVLVNNAGYGALGPAELLSDEVIEMQFKTNVLGLISLTKAALPYLRHTQGTVVNIASMMGLISFPYFSIYCASKWAVEGFSETLRIEMAPHGVRVKIVEPATIRTRFFVNAVIPESNSTLYPLWSAVLKNTTKRGDSGPDPIMAARVIYHAATSTNQRLRYRVDFLSYVLPFLRRISPLRLFQYILIQTVR